MQRGVVEEDNAAGRYLGRDALGISAADKSFQSRLSTSH